MNDKLCFVLMVLFTELFQDNRCKYNTVIFVVICSLLDSFSTTYPYLKHVLALYYLTSPKNQYSSDIDVVIRTKRTWKEAM
jgi:hypothetical protein